MRQLRRRDKLKEIGLQKITDDFRSAATAGAGDGGHGGGPFRLGLGALGRLLRRRRGGLEDTFAPPCEGVLTSPFGPRWGKLHRGVDIAAETGTPIKSVGAGVVAFSGWDGPGYGHLVEIDHGDSMATRYAHCRYGSQHAPFSTRDVLKQRSSGRSVIMTGKSWREKAPASQRLVCMT